jgi:hypothetical protein
MCKITNGRHKRRSGRDTLAHQKIYKKKCVKGKYTKGNKSWRTLLYTPNDINFGTS